MSLGRTMTAEEYRRIEGQVERLLPRYFPLLPQDSRDAIRHYVDHGELEMAFEILCLDLIGMRAVIPVEERAMLRELAVGLGLDRESVFDAEFWSRFLAYLEGLEAQA